MPAHMPAAVLQIAPYGATFEAEVARRWGLVRRLGQPVPAELVASLSADERASIRVLATMGTIGTPDALLDALPNLKLICCIGSGYERIDLALARTRGIAVTHSPGANASAVADMAVTLLLASMRRIIDLDAYVRAGKWVDLKAGRPPLAQGLTGAKVGIVGMGDIGLRIARRVSAFETQLRYHNRRARPDVPFAWEPDLLALADWADALILALRADETNRHLIDARVLAALGPNGHLINITRGSVVDEPALIAALTAGGIAGAGLDVFAEEPHVPEALRRLPNVVLSPHRAGGTHDAFAAMHAMVLANLDAFFAGRPLPNVVPWS